MKNELRWEKNSKKYAEAQKNFYGEKTPWCRKVLYANIGSVKNKKILDLGCGAGIDVAFFDGRGGKAKGVDASPTFIKTAKQSFPKIKNNFFVASFEKLPFQNKEFEIVFSRFAIHATKNLDKLFDECHRVLKKDGIFVFIMPHPIVQLFCKKERNYFGQSLTDEPIYRGAFVVNNPSHKFEDYLTPNILKKFELLACSHGKLKKELLPIKIPDFMFMKFKKR